MITSAKWQHLKKKMQQLGLLETDIQEKFIIGSGRGGQKLHKTASCVYIQHQPSGIEIKCQKSRFRDDNRYFARKRLCEKFEDQLRGDESELQQQIEKIRRQKRRRSKRAQEKILKNKAHRSELKKARQLREKEFDI